jgi:peptide/nickel transport system permease protein
MQLYAKEFIERDGVTVRDHPRLQHGGAHLQHADERLPDIARRTLAGVAQGGWRACCCWACWPGGRRGGRGFSGQRGWRPGGTARSAGRRARSPSWWR